MIELESAKIGEADQSKFGAVDSNGEPCTLTEAIIPIVYQTEEGTTVLGTGFFLTSNGILATANHVLQHVFDERGEHKYPIGILQFVGEDTYIHRPLLRFDMVADAAIAIAAPMIDRKAGGPLVNKKLQLTTRQLEVGEDVFTYAYPNIVHCPGDPRQIHINPRFYAGKISEFFENGRDSMLPLPCYQTTMAIHSGASGGPVFDRTGKVCGINSSAMFDDVSFISSVNDLLTLHLDDVQLDPSLPSERIAVSRLADLGHISVDGE